MSSLAIEKALASELELETRAMMEREVEDGKKREGVW